jgi:hypothetical protein
MRVNFTRKSRNEKTGPIPVSTTSADTCPDACPLKGAGCYADGGPLAILWRNLTAHKIGMEFDEFLAELRALPAGLLWRHNQAGDLPGAGDDIDADMLAALVAANAGKNGFTYTHKPVADRPDNAAAIAAANRGGFTVNLSADTLAEADQLASMGIGPVVTVLDAADGTRADTVTPEGRRVITCPATYQEGVTCQTCKLCAAAQRKTIVGFPAHGIRARAARAVARGAARVA